MNNSQQVFYRRKLLKAGFNKRRSRTTTYSVNVADKKLVEQTTNHFYPNAKFDQKHLDGDLVKKLKPIALEIDQFEKRHTENIN